MKNFFEKFRELAGGYGGMLFIATLGLSVLIFGGILTNARKARELTASIEEFEQTRKTQKLLQPIVERIAEQRDKIEARSLPVPQTQPLTTDEIPQLKQWLEGMASRNNLRLVSTRHSLETSETEELSLRVEVRLAGDFIAFRDFLDNILQWKYSLKVEGFSLRSFEEGQDMQLILRMGVT